MTRDKELVTYSDNGEEVPKKNKPSSKGLSPQHNKLVREKAKVLYMKHWPNKKIAKHLNIRTSVLENMIRNHDWPTIRDEATRDIMSKYIEDKASRMKSISVISLEIIEAALKNTRRQHIEDNKPVSLAEAKLVADIFSQVDKIHKLDTGQATERKDINTSVTLDDLREAFQLDGYIDITDTAKETNIDEKINDKEDKS